MRNSLAPVAQDPGARNLPQRTMADLPILRLARTPVVAQCNVSAREVTSTWGWARL